MPERIWRHRPPRNNACVSRYTKDEVTVVLVRPGKGLPFAVVTSSWGPWVVDPSPVDDLEVIRRLYVESHPLPASEPVVGPSVYELLRRREL
jgi:hypothetical protein